MTETRKWAPDWAVVPGEVLVEALEERGMTQSELARRIARPLKTISEIATGKAAITADTALQLERALGISAGIWLGLESRYREAQARERDQATLQEHVAWLKRFPLPELTRRGIIRRGVPRAEQVAQLLSFFGVSSAEGWQQHWGQIAASYRMSERARVSPHALAVWLRDAEREAEGVDLPPFELSRLRNLASELRQLTAAPVLAGAIARARELLYEVGVGVLVTEGVTGAPASGAVRWIRRNPWIVLTMRYGTDDQFWFSLFHEIGHLLEGGRRRDLVEELHEAERAHREEQAANAYAREVLVPQGALDAWLADHDPDGRSIRAFAEELGVSPGIVVGRLQRDGVLEWTALFRLKQTLGRRQRR